MPTFQEFILFHPCKPKTAYEINMAQEAFSAGCNFACESSKSSDKKESKNAARYEAIRTLNCLPIDQFRRVIDRITDSPDGTHDGFDARADALIAALAANE